MALEEHLITRKEFDYLTVHEFNIPMFYMILKLHKSMTNPLGRPIVSAIKGPLERIGKYVETLIKELEQELLSFVQDIRNVLCDLENFSFPPGALLVGIDVESLYTSIPHGWGLKAVYHFLECKFPSLASQNEFIVDMLKFMLEHNCFQFLGIN